MSDELEIPMQYRLRPQAGLPSHGWSGRMSGTQMPFEHSLSLSQSRFPRQVPVAGAFLAHTPQSASKD
jgi:hypothetical protein